MHDSEDNPRGPGQEFAPGETEAALASFDRRTFLRMMGAGLAMAGVGELGACSRPQPLEKIVPRVTSPEGALPGIPRFYASALPMGGGSGGGDGGWMAGFGRGVVVEQHEGRPTKIEGNPDHPSSLGGTDIFMQAAILQLYDPDRSKHALVRAADGNLRNPGQPVSWGMLINELRGALARGARGKNGSRGLRLRILSGTLTSPTVADQLRQLRQLFPAMVWHVDDSAGGIHGNQRAGQRQALGRTITPVYDFTNARRIVSLDSHFLFDEPGSVRYAREFAFARRMPPHTFGPNRTHADNGQAPQPPTSDQMSRLYLAESTVTFTGAMADERLALSPGQVITAAAVLARSLADSSAGGGGGAAALPQPVDRWVRAAAADLRRHHGASLIVAGEYQPPEVHALALAMNASLGAPGNTLHCLEPVEASLDEPPGDDTTLKALTDALSRDEVDFLLILGVNPACTAPADLPFAQALREWTARGGAALSLAPTIDETAQLCSMHVPLAHPLEAWGDIRGHEGTASIIQPLIQPLFGAKSAVELLGTLIALAIEMGGTPTAASSADLFADGYDWVRRYWIGRWKDGNAEMRWRKALHDGVIEGTASRPVDPPTADLQKALAAVERLDRAGNTPIEIVIRPDPAIGDGSWANHPWLQELPRPLSRVTWDNVALLSPATAAKLGIEGEHQSRSAVDAIEIAVGGKRLVQPAWIQPGHPDGTITLFLGGGRRAPGRVQEDAGIDVTPLRTQASPWRIAGGVEVRKADKTFLIASTQSHQTLAGRDLVRQRDVGALPEEDPDFRLDLYSMKSDRQGKKVHLSLYDEFLYTGYKWGMVIDLSACIGCQACVIACQAENNIPTVGKDQVSRGREMHWLRIDTYFGGEEARDLRSLGADAGIRFQPMLCQHCENAPCEVVCPVEATSHSSEGLNEMTYNRCVGTRYCSNNCPYKVRRFNFLHYSEADVDTWKLQKNPNVTVRSRGVMEKCTYCVQRINRTRIDAKRQWARSVTSGEKPVEMRTPAEDPWARPEALPRMRLQTACQQACPTEAIIFGDMNDADALVSRLKCARPWSQINYGVLTELNTQPRTTYLERFRNPAEQPPAAEPAASRQAGGGA